MDQRCASSSVCRVRWLVQFICGSRGGRWASPLRSSALSSVRPTRDSLLPGRPGRRRLHADPRFRQYVGSTIGYMGWTSAANSACQIGHGAAPLRCSSSGQHCRQCCCTYHRQRRRLCASSCDLCNAPSAQQLVAASRAHVHCSCIRAYSTALAAHTPAQGAAQQARIIAGSIIDCCSLV